jgi:hypothetical protein
MWQTVYVAEDPREAKVVKDLLQRQGFLVQTRDQGGTASTGSWRELQVPEVEADEALAELTQRMARPLRGRRGRPGERRQSA